MNQTEKERRKRGSRQGYTMAELLGVLVIMAVITAISVQTFIRMASASRVRGGAGQIATVLRSARRYAISRRTNCAVWVYLNDPATHSLDEGVGYWENTVSYYETETAIAYERMAANVYITDPENYDGNGLPQYGVVQVTFNPRGGATGQYLPSGSWTRKFRVVDSANRLVDIEVKFGTGRVTVGNLETHQ